MPIHIHRNVDPLSASARAGTDLATPVLASSDASRLLRQELERYCAGGVRGRSFLIAGHRGAGKTTMVEEALRQVQASAYNRQTPLYPLRVALHGPSLLEEMQLQSALADAVPKHSCRKPSPVTVNVHPQAAAAAAADQVSLDADSLTRIVLIEVVLGLHQAASKLLVESLRDRARGLAESTIPATGVTPDELGEIAAQLEIELTEGPRVSRLRQLWEHADALSTGVLPGVPRPHQGLRELVALAGLNHVYQRVSGKLQHVDTLKESGSTTSESAAGLDLAKVEFGRALYAILPAAAVATAGVASGQGYKALLYGALTAIGTGMALRFSVSRTRKSERTIDQVFVPNLNISTLNRVIPALLDRLKAAGIAPVIIIDELDKVDRIEERIYPLIKNLKKLFAEELFTCLIVDRGFYQNLLINEEDAMRRPGDTGPPHGPPASHAPASPNGPAGPAPAAGPTGSSRRNPTGKPAPVVAGPPAMHGRGFSFFSHRLYVMYQPRELHDYLAELLYVTASPATAGNTAATTAAQDAADLERIRWILIHRSQLNPLSLNRLVEQCRGPNDELRFSRGDELQQTVFRVHITLQAAIEVALSQPHVQPWAQQRLHLAQALTDAAYYISREWLDQDRAALRSGAPAVADADAAPLDLGSSGTTRFRSYLLHCMNLREAPVSDSARTDLKQAQAEAQAYRERAALSEAEVLFLWDIVQDVSRWLVPNAGSGLRNALKQLLEGTATGPVAPSAALYESLLHGDGSVLAPWAADGTGSGFRWRYHLSGDLLYTAEAMQADKVRDLVSDLQHKEKDIDSWLHTAPMQLARTESAMELLSATFGVLPGTPPWTVVHAAITDLRAVLNHTAGKPRPPKLRKQALEISEYHARWSEGGHAAADFVLNAVLLNALAPAAVAADPKFGMQLQSDGLRLVEQEQAQVAEQVSALFGWLRRTLNLKAAVPWHNGNVPAAIIWPATAPLPALAVKLVAELRALADRGPREAIMTAEAWQAAIDRVDQFTRGSTPAAAPSEVACAALGRGSGQWLDLQLERMTPRRWTGLLFATLQAASTRDTPSASLPPAGMLVPGLRCTGLGAVDVEMQQAVIEAALRGRPPAVVRDVVQSLANAAPGLTGTRRVGLVVATDQSLTELWTGAPLDAFVLVATQSEWAAFLDSNGTELLDLIARAAGDAQVTVAWEALAASDSEAADLFKRFNSVIKVSRQVWLYPSLSAGHRTPSVVRPPKASALWSTSL